jgi:hypothetical protein
LRFTAAVFFGFGYRFASGRKNPSAVAFYNAASRITRLTRTSAAGKAEAKQAVERLVVMGGNNICEGLRVGAQVLLGRSYRNTVAAMILLSDGQDMCLPPAIPQINGAGGVARNYSSLVPPAFMNAGSRPGPIHTSGFGGDHDAAAMHAIAEATGGTFSFVQDQAVIQDAFARCVGGLLSVAVQEARLAVMCLHRGVRIQEVKSGSYGSNVVADGRTRTMDAGELYDDERRRFRVLVYVPRPG